MKLPTTYQGADDPFERDRTLWLRSLPAGARVTKATVTLEPKGGPSFQETFVLDKTIEPEPGELPGDKWGVTVTPPGPFVEIDFHARRTLAAVRGTNVTGANLQVDLGGVYAEINKRGAVKAPDSDPFELPADGKLPGLTVSKFKLSREAGTLDVTRVTIRSTPANVSVRLGEMPPFWTHLGDMVTAATSPDFADVLNAFLAEASAEDGFYAIPFVVHSDSIARLDVTLITDYVIEQPVLPSYLPEVTLPYGYSSLPGVEEDLLTVKLPRGATVAGTGGGVQGAFDATRVVCGEIGESGATARVTVSPGRTLAQPIRLADETPASGVDLPLGNTQPGLAGLHLALQADADGKPSGEVLTSAEVTVEKPVPGGSAWGSAALPAEFRFLPGRRYWLVLQSVSGEAFWDVGPCDPAATPLQASTDGGLSWRTATTDAGERPLAALYRLRHAPERFSVPMQLQVGKGPDAVRVRFDRLAPLGRVEFDLDFAAELGEYLASPAAASPCGMGEFLTNGSFDQPPHDDATRRLFGFDAGSSRWCICTVDLSRGIDLSVERFLTLSVDETTQVRVDCAGADPVHTTPGEIVDAINRAMGPNVASIGCSAECPPDLDRLEICSTMDEDGVDLHPWRQVTVPHGWQCPPEAGGQIWRVKMPTVSYPALSTGREALWFKRVAAALEATREVLPPERIVAALEAAGDEPAMLTQRVPVAGGCNYILRFLFRTKRCIDLGRRQAGTGPNPMTEQGVVFMVADRDGGLEANTRTEDLGRGIQGLNCGFSLEITLSRPSPFVELTLSTGSEEVTIYAFENGKEIGRTKISGDSQMPQTLRLIGARITRVGVVAGDPEYTTLLHKVCLEDGFLAGIFPLLSDPKLQMPSWKIHWLDAEGQLIHSEDAELDSRDRFSPDPDGMLQYEARLVAPSGAAQAEIRFVQPPPGVLFLDDVSLTPTFETLQDSRFQQWEFESGEFSPVVWTHLGGWIDPQFNETGQVIGARLQGGGPEDAVLAQTVEVVAGERYELRVQAQPVGALADDPETLPDQQRARLELHWLNDGDEIGAPVILPLDGRDFPTRAWAGIAPDRATQAEIRLIHPQGEGELLVESVSLSQVDLVSIPLTFLAEAPGELAVSDLRVAYEPPGPTPEMPPPRPAAQGAPQRQVTAAAPQPPTVRRMVEPAAPRPRSPLADRPIGIIAGVGDRFSDVLSRRSPPVTTVAELAALDPEAEVEGISRERRLELKTKAEMITVITVEAAPFTTLADEPLETLLALPPADLARRAGQPAARAEQLQRDLRALRLLLKKDAFRSLSLSDLTPGRG
jgi:hypothetical protein